MKVRITISVILIFFLTLLLTNFKTNVSATEYKKGFFPKGIFSEKERTDKFVYSWYSKQLIALKEPSLYELSNNNKITCYRFLCLRTFHNPFAIRVELKSDGTGLLYFKKTSGAGGYDPGDLIENKTIKISKINVNSLLEKIKNEKFWTLQSRGKSGGLDGSEWIIEGVKKGKYHLVDRWTPETGSIRVLGLNFIRLSKEKIENLY